MKDKKQLIFRGFFGKMSRRLSAICERRISVIHIDDALGRTNGKVVGLNEKDPYVPTKDEEAVFFMKGVAAHELGHLLFTDFSLTEADSVNFKGREAEFEVLKTLDNIVEDTSIEYWIFNTLKGELPRALDFTINRIWRLSQKIEENKSEMAQYITALIQYGDVGLLKGNFTSEKAKKIFYETLPIYDRAIECPSAKERYEIVKKIFELSRPLWEEEAKSNQELIDLMKALQKHKNSGGKGKFSKDAASANSESKDENGEGSSANSKRSRRRKAVKALEEKEKSDGSSGSSEKGDKDSAGEEASGNEQEGSKPKDGEQSSKGDGNEKSSKDDNSKKSSENGEKSNDSSEKPGNGKPTYDDGEPSDEVDFNKEAEDAEEDASLTEKECEDLAQEISKMLADEQKMNKEFDEDVKLPEFKLNTKSSKKERVSCLNINVRTGSENYDRLISSYNEVKASLMPKIKKLTNALKSVIREDAEQKERRTSGRVNLERLSEGRRTARVFDRRVIPGKSDMAVCLCLDESGSMSGRYEVVMKTAIAIAEACHNVRLPIYIMGFTADHKGYDAVHYHYVKWKNTLSDRVSLLSISARYNNFDGYSVRYATEILKKRPESKKLLIVVSDGLPAASAYRGYSDGVADTKDAVRAANKAVTVQGVALGKADTSSINEIYGKINFFAVENEQELLDNLSRELKKRLRQ